MAAYCAKLTGLRCQANDLNPSNFTFGAVTTDFRVRSPEPQDTLSSVLFQLQNLKELEVQPTSAKLIKGLFFTAVRVVSSKELQL